MKIIKSDLQVFEDLIDRKIEEKAETLLATKDDIKHLPSKEEFYSESDKLMTELKAVREEITILSDLNRKVNDHEERIEKVEKKLDIQPAF